MKQFKKHPAGVSLPLVVTLLILLVIGATTAYQIIIRSLNTADNIEDSSRAYFAAEAGVEDALYELSAHSPGYETPDLDSAQVRTSTMDDSGVRWDNQWEIKNLETTGDFSGELYAQEKLRIHFFEDVSGTQTDPDEINSAAINISPVNVSNDFQLTFAVPLDEPSGYSTFFSSQGNTLNIDNDGDLGLGNGSGPEGVDGLNEDGETDEQDCGDGFQSKDGDCDGSEDEDSQEDPVVICQVFDDTGRTWQPESCINGGAGGAEVCESDFAFNGTKIQATFDETINGLDIVDNTQVTLGTFIAPGYSGRPNSSQVTMECLISAPLVQTSSAGLQKDLPYLEYSVDSGIQAGNGIPLPSFTIRADGWYRDFKQSITTEVIPGESVPLLDITIIQQN